MNKEKLSETINLLMHQNLCVVNNGTKEKPDFVVDGTELLNKELTKLFSLYGVVKSLNADELIKSLGSPESGNEYRIIADKDGKWWIDHKHVGSGEPLKQWLTGKP